MGGWLCAPVLHGLPGQRVLQESERMVFGASLKRDVTMNVRRIWTAAVVLLAAGPAIATVKVGDKAPEIKAAKWYNTKTNVSLEKLRGKIVVIDYWATW